MTGSVLRVLIRPAQVDDIVGMADIHYAAVHQLAAGFYPREVLDSWSRLPDERRYQQLRTAIDSSEEILVVAKAGEELAGWGAVVPGVGDLRAVYIGPDFARRGIGSRLLSALERLAVDAGSIELKLEASINAVAFYRARGYETVGPGTHQLPDGREMACVRMKRSLLGFGQASRDESF